jgi:hypothetical protein
MISNAFSKSQNMPPTVYLLLSAINISFISLMEAFSVNPSAWGLLKPSSFCDVGRFFYRVFKF